ncbi:2782_t:CDS:1, partial [Scutellospora calospora]
NDDIRTYPWFIRRTEMHHRIKQCLEEVNIADISHDEPTSSSIIDTENLPD